MSKLLQDQGTAQGAHDRHTTISGRAVAPVYGPTDTEGLDYARDLGDPGQYPYTRGIHETMYRGRLWTMRQFAGYGSAAQTNARFKYLLEHGGSGLSVAFDLPTLMGRDPDHPLSLGEVGKCGVAVCSPTWRRSSRASRSTRSPPR
jgi:methylmalonyl-CoA mutase N-terminal domain/subunit